ncbi:MAG TPA: hypothetical protein VGA56_16410 [Opitutaceae bacterium]
MNSVPSIASARSSLDAWTREMVAWHFSSATGCAYWLQWAAQAGWDPLAGVQGFDDLRKFGRFDDETLRREQPERFVPKAYAGRPYNVFETGGTTGMPKQRIGWDDYKVDYEEFSNHYGLDFFPLDTNWLMVGPTGPRRLWLAIEHLTNIRDGSCYFVDLDPRWVKRLIVMGELAMARKY